MNDPFSEALLCEDVLIYDRLLTTLQVVDGPFLLNSAYYKLGGSEVGYRMAKAVQRSTGVKPYCLQ